MKNLKLALVGFLTVAGWCATAGDSDAFCCCRDRLNRYSTYICCRPYNAFTPVCFGSISCNGCCPVTMQPPCMPGYGGWMPGGYGCPTYCAGDGCCAAAPGGMPMGQAYAGMLPQAMPQAPPAGYAAMPIQQQSHVAPQMPNMHNVGYQPGYQVPGYYVQPVSYYPMWPSVPVVPNYWYGR